jgi:hypothetical protein
VSTPDFSRQIGELLAEASSLYVDLLSDLGGFVAEESPSDEQETIKVIRRIGLEMAGKIAHINRLIDDGRINGTLRVEAEHDPRTVQPLLRLLGDSFVLLATADSRDTLRELPLLAPKALRRAVWREQIRSWVERVAGSEAASQLGLTAAERAAMESTRAS